MSHDAFQVLVLCATFEMHDFSVLNLRDYTVFIDCQLEVCLWLIFRSKFRESEGLNFQILTFWVQKGT